jgi:hypothetical protein
VPDEHLLLRKLEHMHHLYYFIISYSLPKGRSNGLYSYPPEAPVMSAKRFFNSLSAILLQLCSDYDARRNLYCRRSNGIGLEVRQDTYKCA